MRAAAQLAMAAVERRLTLNEYLGRDLRRPVARQHPDAGRDGPRDHLRPARRHQHGARRDDHDRRLRHLRHAVGGAPVRAGHLRLVPDPRAAGRVPRLRAGRHPDRAAGDPLPLRPSARDAARDLGHQPDPDPDGPADLRAAERRHREPRLDVGRHRLRQPGAALQPDRHHRLLAAGAGRRRRWCCRAPGSGLFVRGVTQNRPMAGAIGVPTGKVDMLAFGLGSGIAGLAGVALSQIGNVGPELGQSYIIDSFIVVVAGGVGPADRRRGGRASDSACFRSSSSRRWARSSARS